MPYKLKIGCSLSQGKGWSIDTYVYEEIPFKVALVKVCYMKECFQVGCDISLYFSAYYKDVLGAYKEFLVFHPPPPKEKTTTT